MKAVLFTAGLGDSIRAFYKTDRYARVCDTSEMLAVIVATHNPSVHECFLHHPNRANLKIIHLPGQYDRFFSAGLRGIELNHALCQQAGFTSAEVLSSPMECRPEFYAADDVAAKDVIVVQPSAGSNNRSLPLSILRHVVSECLRTGREVHLVTRSYPRWFEGRRMHDEETIPDDIALNPGVVWHRNLSVPATLNLVKNCGFFCRLPQFLAASRLV